MFLREQRPSSALAASAAALRGRSARAPHAVQSARTRSRCARAKRPSIARTPPSKVEGRRRRWALRRVLLPSRCALAVSETCVAAAAAAAARLSSGRAGFSRERRSDRLGPVCRQAGRLALARRRRAPLRAAPSGPRVSSSSRRHRHVRSDTEGGEASSFRGFSFCGFGGSPINWRPPRNPASGDSQTALNTCAAVSQSESLRVSLTATHGRVRA